MIPDALVENLTRQINDASANDRIFYAGHIIWPWSTHRQMSLVNLTSTEAWVIHEYIKTNNPLVTIKNYQPGRMFVTAELIINNQLYYLGVMCERGNARLEFLELFHIKKATDSDDKPEI